MTNPFLLQDVNTIIDAFADPSKPGEKTPGEKAFTAVAGLPDWLKQQDWGGGSVASASENLQGQMDDARATIDSLYSYGTRHQPPVIEDLNLGVTAQGVNIQNTWHTIANADNVGDAMKVLAADCIPCKDRVLALLSLNPIEDLWRILDKSYSRMTNFLLNLFNIFLSDHSVRVFADICSLLKFLNFMCVPDLFRMIIVLSNLVKKYTFKLKDIELTFSAILGRLMGPALTPLATLMDKYIQLIIAPIECMVESLDSQLHKLDVVQAWKKGFGGEEEAERTFSLDEIAGPLQSLKKYLKDAVDEVREEFEKLQKNIDDWLSFMDERDARLFDVMSHIETVTKIVGLIQAVIFAIQQGIIVCGPNENASEEALEGFLNNFVASNFDVSIGITDGKATIRRRAPEGIEDLLGTLAIYEKEQERKDLPRVMIQPTPAKAVSLGQVVVPLKNCLYTTTDAELERVREFLGSFQEGDAG